MGNEACTMSFPQAARCEECLRDLPIPVSFEEELRGSRSFKVAKVRCEKGSDQPLKVVKIYQICKADASVELAKSALLPFCRRVERGFNLLPVETFASEKYAFISRDFVDQSLAERIGTRPFLTFDEKRWIAFQLLSAVQQLHAMKTNDLKPLCHGDIKPQNVLLTSWGWLLLADPAPFKPTQLPSDNPSEFTHIFDSSRHRFCYLAPERFTDPRHVNISSAGDTDGDGFSSMPENLNLKGGQSPLRDGEDDFHVTIGEVADESLENFGDDDVVFKQHQEFPIGRMIPVSGHVSPGIANLQLEDGSHFRLASGSMPNVVEGSIIPGPNNAPLQPSMDLFSVGCVLLELFTDGTVPFKLSDMLNYRRNQNEEISKLLDSVSDSAARSLITELISLNPEERGSATYHLEKHRGGLFPGFFFSHLQPFMQSFLEPASASPAVRLRRIRQTLPILIADLEKEPPSVRGSVSLALSTLITASLHCQLRFHRADPVCAAYASYQPLSIIPPVLSTPLAPNSSPEDDPLEDGLISLLFIVQNLPSLPLFNRLWPHLTDLITNSGIVCLEFRCLALDALVQSLEDAVSFIEKTPPSGSSGSDADLDTVIDDVRFLNEFLLPSLSSLVNDDGTELTMAMAECLPRLTVACQKILCLISRRSHLGWANRDEVEGNEVESTDARRLFLLADSLRETDKVRDWLQHQVVLLLSDNCPDNFVRRTVIYNPKELAEITTFLGQKLTIDVILGHLTTFLNAKDVNVRAAFFAQVPTLVSLCGGQSVPLLRPLLESGLADGNETILSTCLRSLVCLQRDGQMDPILASGFIPRVLNLTAHPSAHIRQCCIAFITAMARPALRELHNAAAGPLNDLTVETQFNEEDDNVFAGLNLFSQGLMGFADIHAVLGTPEIIETYFKSPIGDAFTNDAVLLAALNQDLAPASLESVVKILVDMTNSFSMEDAFDESPASTLQPVPSTPRQLCVELLKHLRERQSIRHSTRKGEHPWYPISPNDGIAEVLKRLQALEITDQKEDQLLLLTPQLESLCASASDPRGGFSSASCGRASSGLIARVEAKSSGQIDVPGLRLHCLPAKPSTGVRIMKLQPFSSPELNIEIRRSSIESNANKPNISNPESSPAYSEVIATRINEGRFALPSHPPPPNVIFSRSLTLVDDAVSVVNDLGLSISSGGGSRVLYTGYLLSGDVPKFPSWVPNRANSSPRLRHLVHLHEHKAGYLSLALHPLEYRFVSCSSGDGQLKVWDLSRPMLERQPITREFESEEEEEAGLESDSTLGVASGEDISEVNTPVTGNSLPSRSISTYAVQSSPNSGDERPSCRYLVWTDGGSSVATLVNRSSIHLIDLSVNCQRAVFPIKTIEEVGSATYLTSPGVAFCNARSSDASNECLQAYSYCGTDRNLVVYSTSGGYIVGQDVRISEPVWRLNQGFDYGLITCLAVHSGHTWLTAGTNHNHLINWDLRYQRPISEFELLKVNRDSAAFTKLKIYDVDPRSTLICAATDCLNEVAVFALEDSKPRQSCKVQVIATRSQKIKTNRSVRSLLVLPPSAQMRGTDRVLPLPSLVTGGADGRLRYWNLAVPEESAVLAWEGVEGRPRPRVTFSDKIIDGMKFVHECEDYPVPQRVSRQPSCQFKSPISSNSNISEMSPYVRLEMGEVTIGHTNIISDLIGVNNDSGRNFLVSAAMNGVIKIWN
ncbi:hypothetical protein Aperf_G00000064096 [Anoplocephala perfoliata]